MDALLLRNTDEVLRVPVTLARCVIILGGQLGKCVYCDSQDELLDPLMTRPIGVEWGPEPVRV